MKGIGSMSFSPPTTLILLAIVVVVFTTGDNNDAKVNAFVTGVSKIDTQRQLFQENLHPHLHPLERATAKNHRPSSSLSARIYGVDGTVVNDDEFENRDTGAIGGNSDNHSDLLESLLNKVKNQSVWTRIGCAFAPAPHDQLTPELVRNAQLVRVGSTGIDVALAVPASRVGSPSADQLAQVLVTVGYPQSWSLNDATGGSDSDNDSDRLRMLVQQIRILEGHATDRLSRRNAGAAASRDDPQYYEKIVIEKRWLERLQEEADDDKSEGGVLPDWWRTIAPKSSPLKLVDECKLLKTLLNEDEFEDELRALFVKHSDSDGKAAVLRAAVASIGAYGLYLKARVVATDDDGKASETLSAVAVPYVEGTIDKNRVEFPTTNELREAVLVLVESVTPMPKPPPAREMSEAAAEGFVPFNEQVVAVVTEAEEKAKREPDVSESDSEGDIMEAEKEEDTMEEKSSSEKSVATAAKSDDPPMKEVEDDREEEAAIQSTSTGRAYIKRKSPEEEAKLSEKYAAIDDLEERAYTILRDLNMI